MDKKFLLAVTAQYVSTKMRKALHSRIVIAITVMALAFASASAITGSAGYLKSAITYFLIAVIFNLIFAAKNHSSK